MTRATFRAFKCRLGVHRFLTGWYMGDLVLSLAYCQDCKASRIATGDEPKIRRQS